MALGLNIGRFDTNNWWDGRHNNSQFRDNTISAGYNLLSHGLSVGSYPYPGGELAFDAGHVTGNSISGAQLNLVIDGIEWGTVQNNSYSNPQGNRYAFTCGWVGNYTAANFAGNIQGGYNPRSFKGCS